jgi:hypothetical protein
MLAALPEMGPPAATISINAEAVAQWQQLLDGYSTRGGRGHHQGLNRGRQLRSAGGSGLGTATDGYRQWDLRGNIQRNPSDFWGDRILPKEPNKM